ncbi:MAG: Bug family tripartite tricarboxylate transporter substrate binding protein [Xanthobacteraceae bacterium]
MWKALVFAAAITSAGAAATALAADDYPVKPIKIIVPVSPGGITDIVARVAADYITAMSGQPVVVENRTGAGGNIGVEAVAKAAPDGYVLSLASTSQIAINQFTTKHMGFDPLKDLVPVAPIAEAPQLLVVNAQVPARTLAEFIAYAKRNPGKLNYVSLGPGSTVSLAADRFVRLAQVDMVPIQYRGTAPGITDLVAGNVQMISIGIAPVLGFVQSGALRALAAGTHRRLPYLPDVPTAAEAGLPGYEMSTWFALFAPQGTPKPVVDKLNGMMRALVADPAAVKRLDDLHIDPMSMTADDFAAFVQAEAVKWGRIVKEAGTTAQ